MVRREARWLVVKDGAGYAHRLDPRRATGFNVGLAQETAVSVGDRLLLRANLQPARLHNGDIVEVAGIGSDGAMLLQDGRTVPAWFREFCHGYAATSPASQGKIGERGILLMAEAGIAAGNLKQAYVSNSRFRESQTIDTSDKKAARDAMMRSSDRKLVLEVAGREKTETLATPRRSWRVRWAARLAPVLRATAA